MDISRYIIFPIKGWLKRRKLSFVDFFTIFQRILEINNSVLDLMTEMTGKLEAEDLNLEYIYISCYKISDLVHELIKSLDDMAPYKYKNLFDAFHKIYSYIKAELDEDLAVPECEFVLFYEDIDKSSVDIVGAKNANLGELKNLLKIRIPDGFAITTRAFKEYLEQNQLWNRIKELCKRWQEGWLSTSDVSSEIRDRILKGDLPEQLVKEIRKSIKKLKSRQKNEKEPSFAIRSSAWGEDTEQSTFAGQYVSLLNKPAEAILDSYKEVVASVYSERAMEYRRIKGYREHEVAMAVACQVLIDSRVSGIMYTLDPQNPESNNMIISATWGLGAPLASGYSAADQFVISRQEPYEIKGVTVVKKEDMLVPKEKGETSLEPVPEEMTNIPSLTNEQLKELVQIGLKIEKHFLKPQDIEFTYDKDGNLYILQTRPLNIETRKKSTFLNREIKGAKIIMSGKGNIAQRGIAFGPVFIVRDEEDLEYFPKGAILVAENALPDFAKVIKRANAIVTDIGSPISHLATIAREFKVPAILNTGTATKVLKNGQEITVDAERNIIYEGKVQELFYSTLKKEPSSSKYEYRLLNRILKKIVPLNLVNPMDSSFSPKNCKTYHDITRFVHEKAVEEIINISLYVQNKKYPAKKLDISIPIDLVIVDIGGGLRKGVKGNKIKLEDICSIPMKAIIEGILTPGIWSTEPVPVDFGSFMSSLTRTFAAPLATPQYVGQNLAVISKEYANISLRLGYHFNLIDAYISNNINANYIYFRFVGGATDISRRSRRARLIGEILNRQGFTTELRGDLVVARIGRYEIDKMVQKLKLVGMLVGFTRQLDVQMVNEKQVDKFIKMFDQIVKRNL